MRRWVWTAGVVWLAAANLAHAAELASHADLAAAATRPAPAGDALRGTVRDDAGRPLAGATVILWTAGPKVGTATLCPSCYADCGKRATADAEGAFRIDGLDPTLKFRVLALAKDRPPTFVRGVDPSAGPIEATLASRPADLPASRLLRLRVRGPDGRPVAGAVFQTDSASVDGRWLSSDAAIEALAVTDEAGELTLAANFDGVWVDGKLEARGLATRRVAFGSDAGRAAHVERRGSATPATRPVGDGPFEIALTNGVTLAGAVARADGSPAAGVPVQAVDTDRTADSFMGYYDLATDADGRFAFANLPPGRSWYVFAKMSESGVASPVRVAAPSDDATVPVGTLTLGAGHRVSGRVVLGDGKPLPADTRLMLGREDTWDNQSCVLDAEGRFAFDHVPAGESIDLTVRVPGYRVDGTWPHAVPVWQQFLGSVDDGSRDLVLRLEPGDDRAAREWPTESDAARVFAERLKELRKTPFRPTTRPS